MKILHISTKAHGGAGIAALRLHRGMLSAGLGSNLLVLNHYSADKSVLRLGCPDPGLLERARRKCLYRAALFSLRVYNKTRLSGSGPFSLDRTRYTVSAHPLVREADTIILHWTSNMVDYNEFFPALGGKPVVLVLHDMNPITGGCHYTGGCEKYLSGCGACPALGSANASDPSKNVFARKGKAYRRANVRVVAPSRWMLSRVLASPLLKDRDTRLIPHGVPVDVFKKRDRSELRAFLGLPKNRTLILSGADYASPRKGMDLLAGALRILEKKNTLSNASLVLFGRHEYPGDIHRELPCPVHSLGYLYDERLRSAVYSSCDVFVSPSREEAFGLMPLESMASGTPVLGFNTGGLPDMVIPFSTGLLAKPGDVMDLAEKLELMITRPEDSRSMGENARRRVEKEFTIEKQVGRYVELSSALISDP
jgi:glycosyltransferase involved in cell wall biosynthesis